MPRLKQAAKRNRVREAVPVMGVVGMSLSLTGGASAATALPPTDMPVRDTVSPQVTLNEEEIADVSLGTFYVFDKETDSGNGVNRKVDIFGTNQYIFTLLDSTGTPSGITTTCNLPSLTVN